MESVAMPESHRNNLNDPCPHCLSEPCICDTETPSLFEEDDGA